jgi:23S rRNA (guanine2445-N2)-methyltransferase / 23S rRNA (guanine2069-N7)-methyltransferase
MTPTPTPSALWSPGAEMLANRLRKNRRLLGKWARREGITCYRLYDADLPEYAVAIDIYEDWAHVQEYAAPASIDAGLAAARLGEVLAVVPAVLEVPSERIAVKVRRRQKGLAQYERQAARGELLEVGEGGLRFLVNLTDYLDTGLFLDHRPTRALIRSLAAGRRFLNLFAYTGTASAYAAAGGASTMSVDMSTAYLDWAQRNLALNGFRDASRHRYVRADCLRWLAEQPPGGYDLIFLDPPTFSTSKRMGDQTLDIQRDHVGLIRQTVGLLAPGGVLLFSTNFRRFRLEAEALDDLSLEDFSAVTLPRDFARTPRIHACWRIARREGVAPRSRHGKVSSS